MAYETSSGLQDSGERTTYTSGAMRDTAAEKSRPDLISPFALMRLGEHMRKGALKYAEWNWAKGMPSSRYYAALQRHLLAYAQGAVDEDHLAAAMFNIMALIHNEEVEHRAVNIKNTNDTLVDFPIFEQKGI